MGHKEADPLTTHDQCPDGAPWLWDMYMDLVQKAFNIIGDDDDPSPLVA
jgi:hypothetical protein